MILVISYPGEEHTVEVVQRLERQGREVVQIDLAEFPMQRGMALTWSNATAPEFLVQSGEKIIDLGSASVGWWRRVRAFTIDSAIQDTQMRSFAESETAQAVYGTLDALPCTWINNRAADDAAHHKPFQWATAHQVGLRLPRTLVTTQPHAARAFIQSTGKTVFKPFLASIEEWRETRLVEQRDLDQLDLVRYAPVIFQEYIDGVDLRITVVGAEIFAAEIDARHTSYPVDMRMVVGEAHVSPLELPASLQNTLLELQKRLGLTYGAIDMRRTANGEYYFLEVNPAGQWLFAEQSTGLQISDALSTLLTRYEDQASIRSTT